MTAGESVASKIKEAAPEMLGVLGRLMGAAIPLVVEAVIAKAEGRSEEYADIQAHLQMMVSALQDAATLHGIIGADG
jgi:hypothetical protein